MIMIPLALVLALAGDPDTTKVTADFANAPLSQVLEYLTVLTEVPIELDDAAKKKLGDPAKFTISVNFKDITVTAAAKLILTPHGLSVKAVDAKKLTVTVP